MQIYARATGQVRCVTCVEFNLYCTMLKQFHTSLIVMPSRVEGEPFKLVPQSGELSFILSNVKSLLSKVEVLETVLRSSFITMAFITETWLSETIHDSAVAFDGYSLVRRDRVDKLDGGVCAYIKSSIPFKVLQDLQDEYFESLWLYLRPYKLPRGFSCLIVCAIYPPPASDDNALIDHITSKNWT